MNWISFIFAFIGTLSWIPYLFEKFSKVRLQGKLISQYFNKTKNNEILVLYKISLVSCHKDFF